MEKIECLIFVGIENFSSITDFQPVRGIRGVYFANQLENIDYINRPTSNDAKTRLTYNLGGDWSKLDVPTDTFSKVLPCQAIDCGMQLHFLATPYFNRIYSNANSIGILLATGNVGQYLDTSLTNANTFLSRDGGWTWMKIRNGSHTYELTDHGIIFFFFGGEDEMQTCN